MTVSAMTDSEHRIEIIALATDWCGCEREAIFWYHNSCISGLGDITPEKAVEIGHPEAVKNHVRRKALGGYA